MSTKLDKSLDEILVNRRQGVRNRRRNTRSKAANAAVPVGGVKKTTKSAKPAGKAIQNGHPISTESKIMVSGLVRHPTSTNAQERD
jgi:THO complex subunit 4